MNAARAEIGDLHSKLDEQRSTAIRATQDQQDLQAVNNEYEKRLKQLRDLLGKAEVRAGWCGVLAQPWFAQAHHPFHALPAPTGRQAAQRGRLSAGAWQCCEEAALAEGPQRPAAAHTTAREDEERR